MKKSILIFTFLLLFCQIHAQDSKWQLEPAIFANLFIEIGISNMIYYNLNDKYSLAGHTGFAIGTYLLDLNSPGAKDIESDYRYYVSEKVGLGRKFTGKKSASGFFLMSGVEYRSFQGSYVSPDDMLITSSGKETHLSLGLLYTLQTSILKSRGFSFKVYIPFMPYHLTDNIQAINFDFGLRINLPSIRKN